MYLPITSTLAEFASFPHCIYLHSKEEFAVIPPRWRLRKNQKRCSACAIFAYNGLEPFESQLTIPEMMTWMHPKQEMVTCTTKCPTFPSYLFILGKDRLTPVLVPVKQDTRRVNDSLIPFKMEPNWSQFPSILLLEHSLFYPLGHFIVMFPTKFTGYRRWVLRDCWRKNGIAISLNAEQAEGVFAYASVVLSTK